MSHFIQVFNLGVARGTFARSDRAFYGLDVSRSDVPPISTYSNFTLWARKLIDGEAARIAAAPAGTPAVPMALPSAGEVAAALALVENTGGRQSTAKDAVVKESADVETGRPAVDALILDMWDTIEFKLRSLDGPTRRRRAREWGIVYLARPGETPDPTPAGTGGGTAPTSGSAPGSGGASSPP